MRALHIDWAREAHVSFQDFQAYQYFCFSRFHTSGWLTTNGRALLTKIDARRSNV